ncbi:MAG: hypothetical protein HZB13_17745 [Acidobacteria bacterium]|nr:hypothetical protein [Acidobacteriota bacterium]
MGNNRWKWSSTARRAFSILKEDSSEDRKFMAIAAFDPLLKKWNLADVDYTPRTGTFPRQQHFEPFLSPSDVPRLADPPGRLAGLTLTLRRFNSCRRPVSIQTSGPVPGGR